MRNRHEFIWLVVVVVMVALAARFLRAPQQQRPDVRESEWFCSSLKDKYPHHSASLARTSFRVEKWVYEGRTPRRYSFFIHGIMDGADYEASLNEGGQEVHCSGKLSGTQFRGFIDILEFYGVWKLVGAANVCPRNSRCDVFMQAGDWSNSVTLSDKDTLDGSFLQVLQNTIVGDTEVQLASELSGNAYFFHTCNIRY